MGSEVRFRVWQGLGFRFKVLASRHGYCERSVSQAVITLRTGSFKKVP